MHDAAVDNTLLDLSQRQIVTIRTQIQQVTHLKPSKLIIKSY